MPYGITQYYLPTGRGDIPAVTPAEVGTRLSDPEGMQGWVDLGAEMRNTEGVEGVREVGTREGVFPSPAD